MWVDLVCVGPPSPRRCSSRVFLSFWCVFPRINSLDRPKGVHCSRWGGKSENALLVTTSYVTCQIWRGVTNATWKANVSSISYLGVKTHGNLVFRHHVFLHRNKWCCYSGLTRWFVRLFKWLWLVHKKRDITFFGNKATPTSNQPGGAKTDTSLMGRLFRLQSCALKWWVPSFTVRSWWHLQTTVFRGSKWVRSNLSQIFSSIINKIVT